MKKARYLILLLVFFPFPVKADVISSPFTGFGTALSVECIGSYEFSFTKRNTINLWGGIGAVSIIQDLEYPSFGSELAIEFRQYFKSTGFENINIGLYAGCAFMRNPYFYHEHLSGRENSIGFVPGLKLTYKVRMNSWLIGEPYISISTPMYENIGLILTFGVRIGFNKVRLQKE